MEETDFCRKRKRNIEANRSIQTAGLDTDSKIENDRVKLLTLFPEEIWIMILNQVTDLQDFKNIHFSNGYLHKLLKVKQTEYLFPLVWKILGYNIHQNHSNGRDFTLRRSRALHEVAPEWFSPILNCRLVCKTWCTAIDTFYQSDDLAQSPEMLETSHWASEYFTGAPNELNKFNWHFQSTHYWYKRNRNPFLGRRLVIDFHDDSSPDSYFYWKVLETFVKRSGKDIWYCTLYFMFASKLGGYEYNQIRKLIKNMPNLKRLDTEVVRLHKKKVSIESLQENFRSKARLPNIPGLHILKTKSLTSKESSAECYSTCKQYFTVKQEQTFSAKRDLGDTKNIELPHLRQICFKIDSMKQLKVDHVPYYRWNLELLKLKFGKKFSVSWSLVLQWIFSKFDSTLMELDITAYQFEDDCRNRATNAFLDNDFEIPNIKRVNLKIDRISNLEFLLPLKHSLEYLYIQLNNKAGFENTVASDILGLFTNGSLQNITSVQSRKKLEMLSQFEKLEKIELSESKLLENGRECQSLNTWTVTRKHLNQDLLCDVPN